jgi:hypothetical protein
MSGQRKAAKAAARQSRIQMAEARRTTQTANEEAGRNQQMAERGSARNSSGGRSNRTLLMGMLSDRLKTKIGAA